MYVKGCEIKSERANCVLEVTQQFKLLMSISFIGKCKLQDARKRKQSPAGEEGEAEKEQRMEQEEEDARAISIAIRSERECLKKTRSVRLKMLS